MSTGVATAREVDDPELAAPGPYAVGIASTVWVQPDQPDVLSLDPKTGAHPLRDRPLAVDIWYPADPAPNAGPVIYGGSLTGEDGHDVAFTAPGVAVAAAHASAGSFPLVILAHGYGGTPVAMSWLAEDLASKGYVVVGPHFDDPPITDTAKFIQPLVRRPLDIAFVTGEAQRLARAHGGALANADPGRTVLIGYSMGGYGALKAAGATRDLRAVVAIAPASRFAAAAPFSPADLTAPTLYIVGDRDPLVGYDPGVKTLFSAQIHAPRYLLTFKGAGHSLGMNPAPAQMHGTLWDLDWWEDPVWRKDRALAVERHFITAFLGRYVKGDAAMAAYLEAPTPQSADGAWTPQRPTPWDAKSPGGPAITLWKGFQRRHAEGLELRFLAPEK